MQAHTASITLIQSLASGSTSPIIRIKTNEACRELQKDEEGAEYMYQDWENTPESLIGESWLSEKFFELRDTVEDMNDTRQEAFFTWYNHKGHDFEKADADDLVSSFEDEYQGEYDDEEYFAYQIIVQSVTLPHQKMVK